MLHFDVSLFVWLIESFTLQFLMQSIFRDIIISTFLHCIPGKNSPVTCVLRRCLARLAHPKILPDVTFP